MFDCDASRVPDTFIVAVDRARLPLVPYRVQVANPPPLDVARKVIEGLRQEDILRFDGYPEQEGGSVVVIRDGEIVGRYGITRFKAKSWAVASGSACGGTGLQFEGEAYG